MGLHLEGLCHERARLPPRHTGLLLRQRGGDGAFLPDAAFWGGAASAFPSFADGVDDTGARAPGFYPDLAAQVGALSFAGKCATPWRQLLASGSAAGRELAESWVRLQAAARVDAQYVGHLEFAAERAPFTRHLQRELTAEVEVVAHARLEARLSALHVHDRRREAHRAAKGSSAGAWVTAWPMAECRFTNDHLAVTAAWFMGEPVALLRPLLGRPLVKDGKRRGVVDEHGVGVTCSDLDNGRWQCHKAVQRLIAREATRARMSPVVEEVFGVFTRSLREADLKRLERLPRSEKQGIIPDLMLGTRLYELKGIRSDSSHSNYNGAAVTGVEKREQRIPSEIEKQAVRLDREVFGVQPPALGPWQRRLQELGGIKPLAFGQYGELGPGFEALLSELAELGADQAAERYLLENPLAAVGVQKRLLRQVLVTGVQKAQADLLLLRLHFALPGWRAAGQRRDAAAMKAERQRTAAARAGSEGHGRRCEAIFEDEGFFSSHRAGRADG